MFGLSDNKDQKQDSQDAQYGRGQSADTTVQPPTPTSDVNVYGGDYTSPPTSPSIPLTAPLVTDSVPAGPPLQLAEPPTPVPPPTIKMERFASSAPASPPAEVTVPHDDMPIMNPHSDDDLLKMKQQALQSLAPLIDHLEQTPEEKFKTTMMLIQASDNAELVKEAFDAANEITDEKARAQALLDVVNEINYFTHQDHGSGGQESS